MPASSRRCLGFVFSLQNSVCVPLLPHSCHTAHPSYSTSLMIEYSFNTTNHEAPHYVVFFSILCPSAQILKYLLNFSCSLNCDFLLCAVTTGGSLRCVSAFRRKLVSTCSGQKNQMKYRPRGSQYDLRPCGRLTSFCALLTGIYSEKYIYIFFF
jgi:hypothetical protein